MRTSNGTPPTCFRGFGISSPLTRREPRPAARTTARFTSRLEVLGEADCKEGIGRVISSSVQDPGPKRRWRYHGRHVIGKGSSRKKGCEAHSPHLCRGSTVAALTARSARTERRRWERVSRG